MCGIIFVVGEHPQWLESAKLRIKLRGPSSFGSVSLASNATAFSSVLSLREPLTEQPLCNDSGLLQFNGELYNAEINQNDTQFLFDKFQADGVVETVARLRGEYAFVYYEKTTSTLWFARDCIGRRSLLYDFSGGNLIITSVPPDVTIETLQQVPGGQLYSIRAELDNGKLKFTSDIQVTPWSYDSPLLYPYGRINRVVDGPASYEDLEALLLEAVRCRVWHVPVPPGVNLSPDAPHVAILFSGGIDCTLLALMVDRILPVGVAIDLLNVAFENQRKGGGYDTPDRQLGRRSWTELVHVAQDPGRFRFVQIDVPYTETLQHRSTVQQLMWPQRTVMDLSIAIAFYFASRGSGRLYLRPDEDSHSEYSSNAPVLLSGLGADELFGGYTRHTTRLRQTGYDGLAGELELDFDRLHERNLGRDDRVCATWGKEVRYPFLDERVVHWGLSECPLRSKVHLSEDDECVERNMETKHVLRQIARSSGLTLVADEKKRAIQFGARTAKMEFGDRKVRGSDLL